MKRTSSLKQANWGFGFYVDQNGNLHDVFPITHKENEPKEQKSKCTRRVWHVRQKLTTV